MSNRANDAELIQRQVILTVSVKSSDMSNRANDAISIQLSNLEEESDKKDGNEPNLCCVLFSNLEEESDKKDGNEPTMHWWATFIIMICGFAVFIDPLFCYVYVTKRDEMCISSDPKAVWAYFGLRTAIDVFYFIDIIVFLCGREGKKFGACCWKQKNDQKSTVIEKCYLLRRILVALPIPEVLVVCASYKDFDIFYAIFIIVPFQYTLRVYLIYGYESWQLIDDTTRSWLKPLSDLLPFILASYLFGALWYRLAIQRETDCWKSHCDLGSVNCTGITDFKCGTSWNVTNITYLQELCPTVNENKKVFDFGIYLYALQSNSTSSSNLPQRISQSSWWALRNLSSFGSNLNTSMHTLEIYFSILISISGMVLFLVYLNATVKGFQSKYKKFKGKDWPKCKCSMPWPCGRSSGP